MIKILGLFTICSVLGATAQVNPSSAVEKDIANVVHLLMTAIEEADGNKLDLLVANELVYGHSSGKVQNKSEFIEEILSRRPFAYLNIQMEGQTIKVANETAVVRHTFIATVMQGDSISDLKLGNMLIWQRQNNAWKLLARQAYR